MPSTKSYKLLQEQVTTRPGAEERLAALRKATLQEISRYEQRQAPKQPQTKTTSEAVRSGWCSACGGGLYASDRQ